MTTIATLAGTVGLWRRAGSRRRDERLALLGLRQPTPLPEADVATGMIARLRAVVPKRPLGVREAEKVAERQADRLRSELKILRPCLDEGDLASLAWLSITRRENLPDRRRGHQDRLRLDRGAACRRSDGAPALHARP